MRLVLLLILLMTGPALAQTEAEFQRFLAGLKPEAVASGVSPAAYDALTKDLTPDPRVPDLVETQPEFTTPVWDYIDVRVSASRIERGRAALSANAQLFSAIGAQYGVDPYMLGAIWGIETDYGSILDNPQFIRPIVRSLATVAYQQRRRFAADKADFFAALRLAEANGGTSPLGSWAGAIGHLQVNPTNVIVHATDGDGDGRIDLHNSLADALATSARFLRGLGYQPGIDWGFEVSVPQGFDYLLATRDQMRPISFFTERGIARVSGRPFPDPGIEVFLYVPAGHTGPKFLMTGNYLVLKGYNQSDSYALAISHLTDRLKGAGPFVTPWPRQADFPNLAQRRAIQQALKDLGIYDGTVDGLIGPGTQAAYARFQAMRGEIADGFVTRAAYEALSAATR